MAFLTAALAMIASGCRAPNPPADRDSGTTVYRDQMRFGLSFEERMSVAAEVTRLNLDATRRADELYDPFKSRENAVANEEMKARLIAAFREALLAERSITTDELDEIVREYQASLGANLR